MYLTRTFEDGGDLDVPFYLLHLVLPDVADARVRPEHGEPLDLVVRELQVLQLLPCNTYGGPGGEMGAPRSSYAWNGEG